MKSHVRFLISILIGMNLLIMFSQETYSQSPIVTVNIRRPVPIQLATWRTDPTVVQLSITSATTISNFRIGFSISNLTTGDTAGTDDNHPCLPRFTVTAGVPLIINGTQLICNESVRRSPSLDRSVLASNAIPEGDYSFCVRLIADNNTSISATGRLCDFFTVVWAEPPQLVFPVSITDLQATSSVNFNWLPSAPLPTELVGRVRYRIRVVGVVERQEPRAALDAMSPTEVVLNEIVPITTRVVEPNFRAFVDLINRRSPRITQFAWQVQALDLSGNPIPTRGGTQGKSEIGLFNFEGRTTSEGGPGINCNDAITINNNYPSANDTIPWLPPHLIMQWGPYCPSVRSVNYTLNLRDITSGASYTNVRSLNWARGIMEAQGISGVADSITRARLLITNLSDESSRVPTFNSQLRRGNTYEWNVNATFVRNESGTNRSYNPASSATRFNLGLRMPQSPAPENNATVDDGSNLELRFTIPPPQRTNFEPLELVNRSGSSSSMVFGAAQEYIRIRVSRAREMTSPIVSRTINTPATDIFRTGDNATLLFGSKSFPNNSFTATGTYYWQVEYLDPNDTNRVYRQGPIWQFSIGGSPIDARADCIRIFPVAPENRGVINDTGQVRFSISTNPVVNLTAIRGGRLRVWEMRSASEDPASVKGRAPVLDGTFSGNGEESIITSPGVAGSTSRSYFNLPFVNGSARSPYTFRARNNTTYLWAFTMQVDGAQIRRDGQPCTLGEIISSDGIFTARVGCEDVCIRPSPSNTTPSSRTFNVGDEIQIGHFRARLTRATGTGNSLSGEATVNIPVFRGGMQVEFSGLRVNDENVVFDGEMRGKVASESPVNSTVANALTGGLGLTRPQVESINNLANDASRLVSGFAFGTPMTLPIGFDRVIEGQRFVVGIMGMVFKPTDARLNVVLSVPMPWLGPGERLGFGARNICFYPGGFGRDMDIGLVDDLGYTPNDTSWSFHFLAPREGRAGVPADSGTFARFGCNGFEFIRVKAEVNFPRTWMVHSPDDGGHVKAQFTTLIRSSGDFIAEATMEQFSPAGSPDFVMRVDTVSIDLSERDNPRSIRFPEGYRGSTDNTWKGFYINAITMRLPEQLRTFEEGRPPTIALRNFIIDRTGLSFKARAENIIRYPRGDFGGWGASLDTFGLDFVSSSLERGYLMGSIYVPIADSTSALGYSATLAQARDSAGAGRGLAFEFAIRPRDTLNVPLWVARMRINPTSYIRMTVGGGNRFRAEANFSGGISITGNANGIPLGFSGIRFENIHIMSYEPYIDNRATWSFASPQHGLFESEPEYGLDPNSEHYMPPPLEPTGGSSSGSNNGAMSGFPISISGISFVTGTRDRGRPGAGIRFTISVNLQPGNNAISGGTTLSVWGALETGSGPMRAVFDGVDLDSIGIRADMGAVEIEGSVAFYRRDPTFGTGFRGQLRANFVKMLQVSATMQFGSKPISASGSAEFRYWYVDARATLSSGIMVFSGVGIYGFGGGAWYNMVRETPSATGSGLSTGDRQLLTGGLSGSSSTPTPTPGATASGSRYVPSYSASGETFGFYGMITVGTFPTPDAFNCDVRLEISFAGGGIREIRLRGDGYMLAGINNRAQARVTMMADISYNFPDRIFNAIFDVRINAEVVRGGGRMVMYFSPTTWHVKIGDPEGERVNISLLDIIQIQAYMMCGMNLPNSMRVPPEITAVLAVPPPPRGMAELQRGDGFAFGASCAIPPGPNPLEARFLIFYASLKFFAGFDVSLLNYGPNATCANTGGAMGINGWYAMGQMYARIDASIGLFVDLWFVSGRFEILGLRAAAFLRAGLPNPTWLQGAVGGSYSILGGLVRGNCQFQFSIGEECRAVVESGTAGIDWFNEISPNDGATDVSIFVQPSVAANLPLDKPFYLEEPDGNGGTRVKIYRIKSRSFTLTGQGGAVVPSTYAVNSRDANYITLTPNAMLRQRTRHTATYTAFAQTLTASASTIEASIRGLTNEEQRLNALARTFTSDANWGNVTYQTGDRRGQLVEKSIASTFTTETLPDSIRPEEVALSYPRNRQRFFLQDECRQGSISLINNRIDLFPANTALTRYEYVLRFITLPNNQKMEVPFTYSPSQPPYYIGEPPRRFSTADEARAMNNRGGFISFDIPSLANNQLYAVQIIRRRSNPVTTLATSFSGSFTGSALGSSGGSSGSSGSIGRTGAISAGSSLISPSIVSSIRGSVISNMYSSMLSRYGSSLQIQKKSITGFDLGRTVEDNEKLLYIMFFKTSRYNRLRDKIATFTNGTTTATRAVWNLQTLNTSYTATELFDPFDVESQTVELGVGTTNMYSVPPLVSFNAWSRSSRWHTEYTNPMIYDAFNWMRSDPYMRGLVSRRTTYFEDAVRRNDNLMNAPAPDRGINDFEISSSTNPALSRTFSMMSRMRITVTTTRSGSGLGLSDFSVSTPPYAWNVSYIQPAIIGFQDFTLAKTTASRIISILCGGGDVALDRATCDRLRRIATQTYRYPESIRPSSYNLNLFYNYCIEPDSFGSNNLQLFFNY